MPHEDPEPDDSEKQAIKFELANGHQVKVCAGYFTDKPTVEELQRHQYPGELFAIRVYSTEHNLKGRFQLCDEFRDGDDFRQAQLPNIWRWLKKLTESREIYEYDGLDDFLEDFGETIATISEEGTDLSEFMEPHAEVWEPPKRKPTDPGIHPPTNP
jgi:hypothetical protein